MPSRSVDPKPSGLAGRVAGAFIDSPLTPLIVIASVLLGLFAVVMLPREEEPQIKVPMIDVLVSMPGFSAKEVEQRATIPMEKLLGRFPGSNTSIPSRVRARAWPSSGSRWAKKWRTASSG